MVSLSLFSLVQIGRSHWRTLKAKWPGFLLRTATKEDTHK